MVNFNNFEYRKTKIPSSPDAKKIFVQELRDKFLFEIKQSSVYKDYLKKYEPSSVEEFILNYAEKRINLIEESETLLKARDQTEDEGFLQSGREVINYILQKKLFNLQLQWRANKLDIPEIQTSFEFDFWEKNIEYCNFIPPITRCEVNIMKSFLENNYFSGFQDWMFWQFYGYLVEKDENGLYQNMPDWYDYYDEMMGTGFLLHMPDIRGEKEEFYIQIARTAKLKEAEERKLEANTQNTTYLPRLYTLDSDITEFARVYEKDPCFKELFRIWETSVYPEYADKEYDSFKTECAIKILEKTNTPLLIERGMVWHKAIIHCAERYITDKVLEVLDTVYDEYIMFNKLGIAKRFSPEELKEEYYKSMCQNYSEMILKGRELSGEPRDFDFY
jgi:hypothetical protein